MNARFWFITTIILALLTLWQFGFFQTPVDQQSLPQTTNSTQQVPPITPIDSVPVPADISSSPNSQTEIITSSPITKPIFTCPSIELSEQQKAEQENAFNHYFAELVQSPDIDDRFQVMVFGPLPDLKISNHQKLMFLTEYVKVANSPLVAHQLLQTCHQLPFDKNCNAGLANVITNADEDNGMLWFDLAALMIKQRKPLPALEYLHIASTKQKFSEYFFDYIAAFEQLTAGNMPQMNFNQRLELGVGITAATPSYYGVASKFCKTNQQISEALKTSCSQLFNNLAKHGSSVMLQSVGSQLSLSFTPQPADNEARQQQEQQSMELYEQTYNKDWLAAMTLLPYDETLNHIWLQSGLAFGERFAIQEIVREARLKSQNPDYNPCANVSDKLSNSVTN